MLRKSKKGVVSSLLNQRPLEIVNLITDSMTIGKIMRVATSICSNLLIVTHKIVWNEKSREEAKKSNFPRKLDLTLPLL